MRYTLTLDGVPVGRVDLDGAPRSTGVLAPQSAYGGSPLEVAARRLGLGVRLLGWSGVKRAVAARAITAAIAEASALEPRLGLRDRHGAFVAIVRIIVTHFPRDDFALVVAHFRDQPASSAARVHQPFVRPGEGSRPAA